MSIHLNADWKTLAPQANYNSRELAVIKGLSPRQLQRIFQKQFACSPQYWLNEQRLACAHELLLTGKQVKAVAIELGFKNSAHFCRKFKSSTKLTPSEFVLFKRRPAGACR